MLETPCQDALARCCACSLPAGPVRPPFHVRGVQPGHAESGQRPRQAHVPHLPGRRYGPAARVRCVTCGAASVSKGGGRPRALCIQHPLEHHRQGKMRERAPPRARGRGERPCACHWQCDKSVCVDRHLVHIPAGYCKLTEQQARPSLSAHREGERPAPAVERSVVRAGSALATMPAALGLCTSQDST